MKNLSIINTKIKLLISLFFCLSVFGQDSSNKFILIEWEKNTLATEYHLQISDSVKFLNIVYQKKTKDSIVRLDPNPIYRYGRIAAVDQYGVRGEYSEVFQIEQRIVEKKVLPPIVPIPSNYLGLNHSISLDLNEDKIKNWKTYYKINEGKWLLYHDGIQLSQQGINLVQYYSVDLLGNKEQIKAKEYIFDSEAPTVEMLFTDIFEDNEKFLYTGKKSTISLKVTDLYSGILSVKTYLRTATEFKEFSLNENIVIPENFSEKIIELMVIATDRLGNIKSYSKFFKHDLSPPTLNIESSKTFEGKKKLISISRVNAYDSSSGLKIILYSLNNGPTQPYFDSIVISDPGEYELRFQAIDNVGNKTAFQYERIFISDPSSKNGTLKQ